MAVSYKTKNVLILMTKFPLGHLSQRNKATMHKILDPELFTGVSFSNSANLLETY